MLNTNIVFSRVRAPRRKKHHRFETVEEDGKIPSASPKTAAFLPNHKCLGSARECRAVSKQLITKGFKVLFTTETKLSSSHQF